MTDREIDAKVAMHIFGTPRGKIFYMAEGREWITTRLPHYSTDISAAWKIIERLQLAILPQHTAGYRVDSRTNTQLPYVEAWADTAPMAICLAALKAVGVEVKE